VGYDQRRLEVVAAVSRHNSPKDDEHDDLWAVLELRIKQLVEDPMFKPIRAWVT